MIDAGADPNALTTSRGAETSGPGSETPLHYAASSDDADVAEALIDGGANIEVSDGSIGTPLDNAVTLTRRACSFVPVVSDRFPSRRPGGGYQRSIRAN